MGSSFFLPRIVGRGRAAEMCMTGDRMPAAEAYRIGLANHVYVIIAKGITEGMKGLG